MSLYQSLTNIGLKVFEKHTFFKYGFNLSPMYRRSTARISNVSKDLMHVRIKLPISWKNRNYMNTIFGGSMFAAVDPILMIQLVYLIGDDYIVWDKSAEIAFKRPAKENLYADFVFTEDELKEIKTKVAAQNEFEIVKPVNLTNKDGSKVYCEVKKRLYIADKAFYKQKVRKPRA